MTRRFPLIVALSLAMSAFTACSDNSKKASDPETELDAGIHVPTAPTDQELSDTLLNTVSDVAKLATDCMESSAKSAFTEEYQRVMGKSQLMLQIINPALGIATDLLQNSLKEGRLKPNGEVLHCLYDGGVFAFFQDILSAPMTLEEKCAAVQSPELEVTMAPVLIKCIGGMSDITDLLKLPFYQPTVVNGSYCSLNIECISGRCAKLIGTCDGTCVPRLKAGESCNDDVDECDEGLVCDEDQGICAPRPLKDIGQVCSQTSDCKDGLQCLQKFDDLFKECVQPNEAGVICTSDSACGEGLGCFYFEDEEVSKCAPRLQEGEDCSKFSYSEGACEEGFFCQRTGGTKEAPVKTCVSLKGVGEACALEVDTHNNTCRGGADCSPEGICIWEQAQGQVCQVKHEDGTITEYDCAMGYTCSEETHLCVKKASIGEVCVKDSDCFDVATDPLLAMLGSSSDEFAPYPRKGRAPAVSNDVTAPNDLPAITSVRCVKSTDENKGVCQELKGVGGACMARFASPDSGCKGDLLCMPNEGGADANGYTGTCQKAPGVNETCAAHEAYEYKLCDILTAYPIDGETCTCRSQKGLYAYCKDENECEFGLLCLSVKEGLPAQCLDIDNLLASYLPAGMECTLFDMILTGQGIGI